MLVEFAVAGLIVVVLFLAFLLGQWMGRVNDIEQSHLGVLQGAALGIIGLVIGFSFSGAMNRFMDRQDLIVKEANAIGTASLRFDLMLSQQNLRSTLKAYTRARLKLFERLDAASEKAVQTELSQLQQQIWDDAIWAVKQEPTATMAVLPPINEMFDLLATRNAMAKRHLPMPSFLLVVAAVALGSVLLGWGQHGKRWPIRAAGLLIVVLLGSILWIVLDLDFPQRGLIQLDKQPLVDVLQSLE
jgi:hypothetical protein